MKYLVIHFYCKSELPFLKLNYLEGNNYIDKFIFIEFNYTQRGVLKDYIGLQNIFNIDEMKKILYFRADIKDEIKDASRDDNEAKKINKLHNEGLLRNYFTKLVDFNDDDIIIKADADEIIYNNAYPQIFKMMETNDIILLKMYSLYYRLDYLSNQIWSSTIATKYKYGKTLYDEINGESTHFPQWRKCKHISKPEFITKFNCGAHFSWCMTIDELINKFNYQMWMRGMDFKNLSSVDILESAVKNMKYIFKSKPNLKIRKIDILNNDRHIMPESIYSILNMFDGLYN